MRWEFPDRIGFVSVAPSFQLPNWKRSHFVLCALRVTGSEAKLIHRWRRRLKPRTFASDSHQRQLKTDCKGCRAPNQYTPTFISLSQQLSPVGRLFLLTLSCCCLLVWWAWIPRQKMWAASPNRSRTKTISVCEDRRQSGGQTSIAGVDGKICVFAGFTHYSGPQCQFLRNQS